MPDLADRHAAPKHGWRMPIFPPEGIGIVLPGCTDRSDILVIPVRVGEGLRIGSEATLCFRCGPGGSVYHPVALLELHRPNATQIAGAMTEVRAVAARLPFASGYDPDDLTPALMAAYEQELRRELIRH